MKFRKNKYNTLHFGSYNQMHNIYTMGEQMARLHKFRKGTEIYSASDLNI